MTNTSSSYSSNTTFNSNLATVGIAPQTVPKSGNDHYGIIYFYNATRTVDGVATPVVMLYWLLGTGQSCKLSGLINDPNAAVATSITAAYTSSNDSSSGKTLCAVAVPGP